MDFQVVIFDILKRLYSLVHLLYKLRKSENKSNTSLLVNEKDEKQKQETQEAVEKVMAPLMARLNQLEEKVDSKLDNQLIILERYLKESKLMDKEKDKLRKYFK